MTLSYNLSTAERKKLVAAISRELDIQAKYLGMPTVAYEIGDYYIDKAGTVIGPDNPDLEEALTLAGFEASAREYDEPEHGAEDTPQPCDVPQEAEAAPEPSDGPQENESPQEVEPAAQEAGVAEEPFAGQPGAEPAEPEAEVEPEDEDGHQPCEVAQEAEAAPEPSDGPQEPESPQEAATAAQTDDNLTVEVPLAGFTVESLDNLQKMVAAKNELLKEAIGARELPIIRTAETLVFPWFPAYTRTENVQAYTTLISQLCKTAKAKKRITAKEKPIVGSPKFAMRCFLLALGMIGPEFKTARQVLLSRLSGSGSFKDSTSEAKWREKHTKTAEVAENE